MREKCFFSQLHKDNKGAALVSVLVVVMFLSILGTTILFISAANIQTKQTDYNSKVSFYEAERVIELAKTQLAADVSEAAQLAQADILSRFVELDGVTSEDRDGDGVNEEIFQRKDEYDKAFFRHFKKLYEDRGTSPEARFVDYLGSAATDIGGGIYTIPGADPTTPDSFYFDLVTYPDGFSISEVSAGEVTGVDAHLEINNVCVIYTDARGYTSVVKTTFMIIPPPLNWNPNATYPAGSLNTKVDCMKCVTYRDWSKD